MGKIQLQQFEIKLSGNKKVYHNNDQISGVCLIAFNGELDLNYVKIRIKGEEQAKWTKTKWVTSSNDRQSRNITYHQIVTFLSDNFDFLPNVKEHIIKKGVHEIPFTFQLPNDLPNSFKGSIGHIRYWIEAEIEKSLLSFNHETQTNIFISSSLKANMITPVVHKKVQKYSCCFIKRGSIGINVSIPKNGYNGGETIPVSYDIINKKNVGIDIKATLIEKHIFIANKNKKENIDKHITIGGPVIEPGKQVTDVLNVPIPVNTRPSIKSKLIEVKYFLSIHIDDNSSGIKFNIPVIISDQNYEFD